jgi:hypothetical protein
MKSDPFAEPAPRSGGGAPHGNEPRRDQRRPVGRDGGGGNLKTGGNNWLSEALSRSKKIK